MRIRRLSANEYYRWKHGSSFWKATDRCVLGKESSAGAVICMLIFRLCNISCVCVCVCVCVMYICTHKSIYTHAHTFIYLLQENKNLILPIWKRAIVASVDMSSKKVRFV